LFSAGKNTKNKLLELYDFAYLKKKAANNFASETNKGEACVDRYRSVSFLTRVYLKGQKNEQFLPRKHVNY